jgi:hypothetical protein
MISPADVLGHVPRPSLCGVEGHHAQCVIIIAGNKITDDGLDPIHPIGEPAERPDGDPIEEPPTIDEEVPMRGPERAGRAWMIRNAAEPDAPERNRAGILIAANLRTISSPYVLMVFRRRPRMQDHLASKAKWYKAKATECAALAKSVRPNFVREIYRKAAVHYDYAAVALRHRIEEAVTPLGITSLK